MASWARLALLGSVFGLTVAVELLQLGDYQIFPTNGVAQPSGLALTPGGDRYVFGTFRDRNSRWKSFINADVSSPRAGFVHLISGETNDYVWSRFESTFSPVVLRGGAADLKGNLYVCGFTQGNLFRTRQISDELWIAKYNLQGERIWGRQFADELRAESSWDSDRCGVAVDQSGLFVSFTHADGHLVIARFSVANGDLMWSYNMVGSAGHYVQMRAGNSMRLDSQGNVLVFSTSTSDYSAVSTRDFGFDDGLPTGLGTNAIVMKFDRSGNLLWRQFITSQSGSTEIPYTIHTTGNDDVVVCGHTTSATVLNGLAAPAKPRTHTGFIMKLSGFNGAPIWAQYPYRSVVDTTMLTWCATDKAGHVLAVTGTDYYYYDHQLEYDVFSDVDGSLLTASPVVLNDPGAGGSDTDVVGLEVDAAGLIHSMIYSHGSHPDGSGSTWHCMGRTQRINTTCACDDLEGVLGDVSALLNLNLNITVAE